MLQVFQLVSQRVCFELWSSLFMKIRFDQISFNIFLRLIRSDNDPFSPITGGIRFLTEILGQHGSLHQYFPCANESFQQTPEYLHEESLSLFHLCNSTSDCFRQFVHLHKVPYIPLHSGQTFRTFGTLLPSFSFQGIFCFYDCSEDFSNRHTSFRSSFTSSFNSCISSPTCIFKKLQVLSGLLFALDNSRSTWNYSRTAAGDVFILLYLLLNSKF